MLILKNVPFLVIIIFHIIALLLPLGLNQNICLANTPQINDSPQKSELKTIDISNDNIQLTQISIHQKNDMLEIDLQIKENEKEISKTLKELDTTYVPIYRYIQNLYLLHALYIDNERALAIIKSNFIFANKELEQALEHPTLIKNATIPLLNKIGQIEIVIAKYKPDNEESADFLTTKLKDIAATKISLHDKLEQLSAHISIGEALQKEIAQSLSVLDSQLPKLWNSYYLAPPINYLNKGTWLSLPIAMSEAFAQYSLSLPLEFPQSINNLDEYIKHCFSILFLGMLLGFAYNHYMKKHYKNLHAVNVFRTSVPLLYIGISLGVTSVIIENNYYDSIMLLLANLILITGQVLLTWNLRIIDEHKAKKSPLLPLLSLTLIGYIIIYPGIPPLLLTLIWVIFLCIYMAYRYLKPNQDDIPPLEKHILSIESFTLWISLFLAILGLIQLSIIAYIFVTGLCIAIQMNVGCIQRIHFISNNVPQDTTRAIMTSIIIAFAVPLTIVIIFSFFALWIITLPGGQDLISHYSAISFNVGNTHFTLIKILLFIGTFYIARAIITIGKSLLQSMNEGEVGIDDSIIPPLETTLTYTVWGGYIFLVLYSLGMSWASLAVVAGGLSVGVGFGLQNIVNNFLSGLILIFSRSLQENDVIEIGGHIGTVQKINIRSTTIHTKDNAVIYIPNSQFISTSLINWTRNNRSRRCKISIGVAYNSNVETVTQLLVQAAKSFDNVLKYPVPTVQFTDFANSTLNFTLYFWVSDYILGLKISSLLRIKINELFNANNVNMAFPQLDLHIINNNNSHPNSEVQSILKSYNATLQDNVNPNTDVEQQNNSSQKTDIEKNNNSSQKIGVEEKQ